MGDKLFKRGRVWYGWVPKRGGGTRKAGTGCTDKRAAEKVRAQLEREAVDPAYAATNQVTTQSLLDDFYKSRGLVGRSSETLRYYRAKLGALAGGLLPVLAADLCHVATTAYATARLKEGAMRTTVRKELGALRAACKLGKKNGRWLGDLDALLPEIDDDSVVGTRALSPVEVTALSRVLAPGRMAVVAFAVATGCDPGALKRVQRGDIEADLSAVLIRGTKRKTRLRTVPLSFPIQRELVAFALASGDGEGSLLFRKWGNVRRDLHLACAEAKIPSCNPTDLRRTYGQWLRDAGVAPPTIGSAMGHADSRMVERIYGKFTPEGLARQLAGHVLEAHQGGLLMGGTSVDSTPLGAIGAPLEASPIDVIHTVLAGPNEVRRVGVEPTPRGFSVLESSNGQASVITADYADNAPDGGAKWAANGLSPSARAFRALSWVHFRRPLPRAA